MFEKTPILLPLLLVTVVSFVLWKSASTIQAIELFGNFGVHQALGDHTFWNHSFMSKDSLLENDVNLVIRYVLASFFPDLFEFCVSIGIKLVLLAIYFYLVARWLRLDIRWENWFGFSCWTLIPVAIVLPTLEILMWFSFPDRSNVQFQSLIRFSQFALPFLWSILITVQGLRSWTGKNASFCVGVASLPYALYFLSYTPRLLQSF